MVYILGVSCRVRIGTGCRQILYWSSVVYLQEVAFVGVFRWGLNLGVGKAMLMRGGACAAELCLMGFRVFCVVFRVCGAFIYVLWGFNFFLILFLLFVVFSVVLDCMLSEPVHLARACNFHKGIYDLGAFRYVV
jgi:hypothetical protein